jgi:chromosome condensin MukBEF ATPase and DNA-binding subunit MukB
MTVYPNVTRVEITDEDIGILRSALAENPSISNALLTLADARRERETADIWHFLAAFGHLAERIKAGEPLFTNLATISQDKP